MRAMGDGESIAKKFIDSHGAAYAKSPQTDSARSWANINIKLNEQQLQQVLEQVYGSGWAFGQLDAQQDLGMVAGNVWDNWQPGNEGAAALIDPPNGLQSLLDSRGITVQGISDSMLDRIGSQLGASLSQGLGIQETASMVNGVLNDPARAMVIARTETANALIQSNIEQYRAEGVSSLEWLVGDPCDICADNDGVIVAFGDSFPSGDSEPPAHPNCVCDVAPVIDDTAVDSGEAPVEEPPVETGIEEVSVEGEDNVIHDGVIEEAPTTSLEDELARTEFIPGQWVEVPKEELFERTVQQLLEEKYIQNWLDRQYGAVNTPEMLAIRRERIERHVREDKATASFVKNGAVIKNGSVTIKVYNEKTIKPEHIKRLIDRLEKLQRSAPRDGMTVHIGGIRKRNVFGHAILHDHDIRLSPSNTVTDKGAQPSLSQAGTWKMPSLADVSQMEYTLTHEWGHSIQGVGEEKAIRSLYNKNKELGFVSEYGLSKSVEMYAECFTEWFNTAGKTDNAFVQLAAKEFGWKA
jgi:SPP1 gp7 family putative phage head morphogenesis protein